MKRRKYPWRFKKSPFSPPALVIGVEAWWFFFIRLSPLRCSCSPSLRLSSWASADSYVSASSIRWPPAPHRKIASWHGRSRAPVPSSRPSSYPCLFPPFVWWLCDPSVRVRSDSFGRGRPSCAVCYLLDFAGNWRDRERGVCMWVRSCCLGFLVASCSDHGKHRGAGEKATAFRSHFSH